MKNRKWFPAPLTLVLLFLLCSLPLWGEYFYTDDPEIGVLSHLCRRMGRALPFSSFPVHGSDILDLAEGLAADPGAAELSMEDRDLLEGLISQFEEQRERDMLLKGGLTLAYEQRLHSGSLTIDDPAIQANAEDFRRAFLNFSPVIRLHAGGGAFTGPWVAGQVDVRPSWEENYSPDSNFFSKVDITYDILSKGVFAWNGGHVNFFLGRDSIHIGNPQGSTLYPSALLPYIDSVRLNVPLGPFSFDYMLGTIIPKKAAHDVYDSPSVLPPTSDGYGFIGDEKPKTILVVAHRFQWNFGSIKAGIGGTVVYERRNNMFLLTDLLPINIYHNADVIPNNLSMLLDISWTPGTGFNLSAMAGFDDISARTFGIPDGPVPTIPAALILAEYSRAGEDMFMYFSFEGGYTHYLWGNFGYDDPSYGPDDYVRLARAIYRYAPNHDAVLLPLTSPYGPGALWGKIKADLAFNGQGTSPFSPEGIKAGAELLVLAKNSGANLTDTPYTVDTYLDSYDHIFVSLDLPLSCSWGGLELSVSPAVLFGTGGFSLECTLGLRWSLDGRTFLDW
jgi:hypothetical protein